MGKPLLCNEVKFCFHLFPNLRNYHYFVGFSSNGVISVKKVLLTYLFLVDFFFFLKIEQ